MVDLLVFNFGNNPGQGVFGPVRSNYGLALHKKK
jgi:hypothetical protein